MSPSSPRHGPDAGQQAPSGTWHRAPFRRDIQGLRAIAVSLVVLDHLTGWPSGGFIGVDIFFVISGYLITQLMLREHERTGRISLREFYSRRARRIVPAALVVLGATVVAARWAFHGARFEDTTVDALWAAGFLANWRFAAKGTDYLQGDLAPSPIQHYWSLAVEEQFYLAWPVLLILTLALTRWLGRSARVLVGGGAIVVLVVVGASFAWSVVETQSTPTVAYFSSLGRAWELGVGAVLAILSPYIGKVMARMPMRNLLAWLGLAGLGLSSVVITPESVFPGPAAAGPVLATALVIAAGAGSTGATTRMLCNPLTDFLGKISYSLYLWHWPVVVVLGPRLGVEGPTQAFLLISVSLVLASATYWGVEEPVLRSGWLDRGQRRQAMRPTGSGVLAPLAVTTSLLCAFALAPPPPASTGFTASGVGAEDTKPSATVTDRPLGAAALLQEPRAGTPTDDVPAFTPAIDDITGDVAQGFGDDCHQDAEGVEATRCVADFSDGEDPQVVALVGDSHANHWRPAVEAWAQQEGLRLEVFTKSACPLNTAVMAQQGRSVPYAACVEWNRNVLDALTGDDAPSVVFVSSSIYVSAHDGEDLVDSDQSRELITEGYKNAWSELVDAGVPVVAIRDTPAPGFDVIDCIFTNRESLSECAFAREEGLEGRGVLEARAAEEVDGVAMLDLNDYICPQTMCPVVIGGVVVYRDTNHMTATFAGSLAPIFTDALADLATTDVTIPVGGAIPGQASGARLKWLDGWPSPGPPPRSWSRRRGGSGRSSHRYRRGSWR